MNLELSDDQRMLKDSVDRLIADRYQFEQRSAYVTEPVGWSRDVWSAITELGLTMLPFPEEAGGLGLGGIETMIVGEAFGRGLVAEPYLSSIVLSGTAIARSGTSEQIARLLPPIMAGELIVAFADNAQIEAKPAGDGWSLSGRANVVLGGDSAELLILPTQCGLFVVSVQQDGLSRRGYRIHGGGGAADIELAGVAVDSESLLSGDNGFVATVEAGIAFLAAEAFGAMQAALDLTVDYLKTREQFGQPIGNNQALQHRAAEMLVEVEQAKSAAIYAALLEGESDPIERTRGFAAVKAVIGKSGRFVAQNAVQLHGGIGVSEEHIISHYFRRLTSIGKLLGDTEDQVDRLAAAGGYTPNAAHFEA